MQQNSDPSKLPPAEASALAKISSKENAKVEEKPKAPIHIGKLFDVGRASAAQQRSRALEAKRRELRRTENFQQASGRKSIFESDERRSNPDVATAADLSRSQMTVAVGTEKGKVAVATGTGGKSKSYLADADKAILELLGDLADVSEPKTEARKPESNSAWPPLIARGEERVRPDQSTTGRETQNLVRVSRKSRYIDQLCNAAKLRRAERESVAGRRLERETDSARTQGLAVDGPADGKRTEGKGEEEEEEEEPPKRYVTKAYKRRQEEREQLLKKLESE